MFVCRRFWGVWHHERARSVFQAWKVTFAELCGRKYPGLPHIFACLINIILKVEFDYPAITLLSKVHTRIPKLSEQLSEESPAVTKPIILWPLWCYSMAFVVLLYDLCGVTLWPLWCYSMAFVVLLYGLYGVTLWPLWCYSMAFVVLLYGLYGVTLWPLWCYSMAFVVLLYGFCGVTLWPLSVFQAWKVTFAELCGRKYPGLPHIFACLINIILKVEFDYPAITLLSKVHTRIPKLSEQLSEESPAVTKPIILWPLWCYSMAFVVLLYDLCGVTLWPLWCYSMAFVVLLYGLYGVTLWPLWCYSMAFVVLLYGLCGVTLWPLWCYSMAFAVFQSPFSSHFQTWGH